MCINVHTLLFSGLRLPYARVASALERSRA